VTNETHRPFLSVVVPVFNQAASIVKNLQVIREQLEEELATDFEIVVVSDGSIDATEEELVSQNPRGAFRVFHYDRNLGKGYAVKLGALEAEGDWIGFIDADLDLDPRDLAHYAKHAQQNALDFAIGSKRHPRSEVRYPRSRVVASWLFQRFVRVLFRLDVTDTQVGLKVFRREVAEQVLPLLLVKRYAFDIELLAVGRTFGFTRIDELPIRLDYQFTGSGVHSRAVIRALVDTVAIFYRLRILRYYQRRRRLAGTFGFTRPRGLRPSVSVLVARDHVFREADFPDVETVHVDSFSPSGLREAATGAEGELLAIVGPEARAAGNWLSATTPFLARPEIGAVVTPTMAPSTGTLRSRAAAAINESRVGAGLGYFRSMPGNVRYVRQFSGSGIVVRRAAYLRLPDTKGLSELAEAIDATGSRVLYTPESVLVAPTPPLLLPHLHAALVRGRAVGRRRRVASLGIVAITVAVLVLLAVATDVALATVAVIYVVAVLLAAAVAALRYQSILVGALAGFGIPVTHAAWLVGVVGGWIGA
jgi:dolichol-phosphate mannosyltransferase